MPLPESIGDVNSVARRLEEFEALFELLPVAIAIAYDSECREMRANKAFKRMLGVDEHANPSKTGPSGDQLPFRVFRDGHEVESTELPMQTAAREGIRVEGSRCEIHRADGSIVTMFGMVEPLFDENQKPRGCVAAFMDISERELLVGELRNALTQVRILKGLLRICSSCKKIRETDGTWKQMELYIRDHSDAEFTHSYCPNCASAMMGEK